MPLTTNKKSMTPIIAIVLILMMTVAVGATMYYWLTRIQTSEQGTVEQSQERLFEVLSACVNIPAFSYNTITNVTNGVMENCGNIKLKIGDDDIEDVAVVSSEGTESPCSFTLNSSVCNTCSFELSPGEVKLLTINFTAAACSNYITEGIKHDITFYIDRKATVSRTFVPESMVACGVSISNYTILTVTTTSSVSACYNLTINNNGNSEDTFTFSNSTTGVNCGGVSVIDGCTGAAPSLINQITVSANSNSTFGVNQTMGGAAGTCNATITATSRNCAGKSDNVITITVT